MTFLKSGPKIGKQSSLFENKISKEGGRIMGYTWIKKEIISYLLTCGACGNGLVDVIRRYEQDLKEMIEKGESKKIDYFCPGCGRRLILGKVGDANLYLGGREEMKIDYETYIPKYSKIVGKTVREIEKKFGLKINHIHDGPVIPSTKVAVKSETVIKAWTAIKILEVDSIKLAKFRRYYDLP